MLAAMFMATIPPLLFYFICHRKIISGITAARSRSKGEPVEPVAPRVMYCHATRRCAPPAIWRTGRAARRFPAHETEGQTAIVTGAGRGIGRATALAFARAGADVVCGADRRRDRGGGSRGAAGWPRGARRAHRRGRQVGRGDDGSADPGPDREGRHPGQQRRGGGTSPIPEITEELWDLNLAVTLKGVFLCTQAVFTHMCERGRGHIVNVSSLAGRHPGANYGAYVPPSSA